VLHFYLCHNISPQWHTRRLFTTRRSASAVYAIAMCPSVCHKSKFYRNGRTNRANFWQELFLKRKFVYLQNNGTFSENLSQNPDFVKKMRHGTSTVRLSQVLSTFCDWRPSPVCHTERRPLCTAQRQCVARVRLQQQILFSGMEFKGCRWNLECLVLSTHR